MRAKSELEMLSFALTNFHRRCLLPTTSSFSISTMSKALLQDIALTNAMGESVQGETLGQDGKVLALYFAADWCPDCRAFQPAFNRFYETAKDNLDVVFVGSDASAKDQLAHFTDKQGPWWMVPFEGETRTLLKRKFGVCAGAEVSELRPITRKGGIPTLVVIRPDGEVVDFHAADKIERDGIKALAAWQQ
ncbi:hypothetical protein PPTG_17517 [Phytophthora nicotianae INRA-310]|uniref:Thioredoxin domain-containing protein n=1 Tax=Phytophthora nicotianae (strain INRA-310) TaxID=761204 RepID=W2PLE8_PHYN3|nr:hypothetical protein PPTG_17517 [Phytophthora nicotianae INRA-310]ETN01084.1 hypothetical protein PPTG_17517 [Phytophthora nicotianae INRA-310]